MARLDDETLEKVDGLMRKLDEVPFRILFFRYAVGLEHKAICRKMGLCKPTYEKQRMLAEKFIEGALVGAKINLFTGDLWSLVHQKWQPNLFYAQRFLQKKKKPLEKSSPHCERKFYKREINDPTTTF